MTPHTSIPPGVQRQIVLPLSKAVEIAYKSIRLRLSRSLLVTSGIVLALAFLMSVLVSDAMITAMRDWAAAANADTGQFAALRQRRDQLQATLAPLEVQIAHAVETSGAAAADPAFNVAQAFGADLPELQQEFGSLPAPPEVLAAALAAQPPLREHFRQWLAAARELVRVKEKLTAPQHLQAMMKANGIPTTPADIAAGKVQTRWLIGLALLVAFVGILNAMLMSVTERFREIGTMKCLGALDSFIIKLFLLESLFQGVVGTAIGVIVGLAASMFSTWSTYGRYGWVNVPWPRIAVHIGVCLLVGIALTVAGALYPAWQAARMQPIEAMRVDA
jgi:predicted outer membrane lipoprotein